MVMADPRKIIRMRGAEAALEHWLSLSSEGRLVRAIVTPGTVVLGALRAQASVDGVLGTDAKLDVLTARSKLASLAYRTPSRWFRGKSTPMRDKLVVENGCAVCVLYGSGRADTGHVLIMLKQR